jgi:outer membrane receptor protein involved in Fe transport
LSSIPNLPPFDLNVDASYQITPQFTGKALFLFLSGRYSDLQLSNRLSAAGLLSFRLSYDLEIGKMPAEIFAEGRNLFNQKYYIWQGYQEFPLSLFIGISSKIL